MARTVLIAAGGTGGHLFPAQALAEVLKARGWAVHLATDRRVESYGGDFPAVAVHRIDSATMSRTPMGLIRAVWRLATGFVQSWRLVRRLRPDAAIGFGGYPTLPPVLAASRLGVPSIVHDQNAVLGRANRFLAPRVAFIATSVPKVRGLEGRTEGVVLTGNPIRPAVLAASQTPYPARTAEEPFRLLVFGGSQGARFLSEVVPDAIAELAGTVRSVIRVTQQCRPEDLDAVRARYEALGIEADLRPFFDDMPARIAASHLVVSRAGASTCAELTAIGRPAVLIPLPGALDQDQTANARLIDEAGGGWMIDQADLTAGRLAGMIADAVGDPAALSAVAARAHGLARLDGAEKLADLVEQAAGAGSGGESSP